MAGLNGGSCGGTRPGHLRLEAARGQRSQQCVRRWHLRARSGDVDRVQRSGPVQRNGRLRPLSKLSRLDARPSSERPPRGARRDRFLLWLPAGGNRGLWYAGCDHQRSADRAGLSRARRCGLHLDLQHCSGGVRSFGCPGDDARRGHSAVRHDAGRDDRPAVAVFCVAVALLCCRSLRRSARDRRRVAGAADRRGFIRCRPVRYVQLSRFRSHRRHLVGILTDRHDCVPETLAEQAGPAVLARGSVGSDDVTLSCTGCGLDFWRPQSWCGFICTSTSWGRW